MHRYAWIKEHKTNLLSEIKLFNRMKKPIGIVCYLEKTINFAKILRELWQKSMITEMTT